MNKQMIEYKIKDNSELAQLIAETLNLKKASVLASLKLLDDGNTIPFIARYRKELTGSLDDEILREIVKKANDLKALDERRITIFNTLNELGIDDQILIDEILKADSLSRLEDLYRPYKPKKKTRASEAIRKGLQDLANAIRLKNKVENLNKLAALAMSKCDELQDINSCFDGAKDILAQEASDSANLRLQLKKYFYREAILKTSTKKQEPSVFEMYYDFLSKINKLKAYHILAINRGEKQDFLKVEFMFDEEIVNQYLKHHFNILDDDSLCDNLLKEAINDSFKRLILPSLENEIRNDLFEKAQKESLVLFNANLKAALMVPPLKQHIILALDPGYRNGCKFAIVDINGKYLDSGVIYPVKPLLDIENAHQILLKMIKQYQVSLCVIGNGTACKETEEFYTEMLKKYDLKLPYLLVDESGASIYSATTLAAKELPQVPLNNRSAVSLARRVLDPLAELVKIDPKSIGVGQYQHDMNQKALKEELLGVVENCVNQVGVNLNTASISLLSYVAGLNTTIASNIVAYRDANGEFKSRDELLKVAKLGPKTFQQCAGFLRIKNAKESLDTTAIHPESYDIARSFIQDFNLKLNQDTGLKKIDLETYAINKKIGLETLLDINEAISKPQRDIRDDFPSPSLSLSIKKIDDLKVGESLEGVIRNVTAFGAFVDLGIHHAGLIHISNLANKFVKDPLDIVSIGQKVKVKVLSVDVAKGKIQLSLK